MRTRSDPTGTWTRELLDTVGTVPLFLAAPLIRPWHVRWGATETEVAAAMPGDDLVPGCHYRTTRAIKIAAAPQDVCERVTRLSRRPPSSPTVSYDVGSLQRG